MRRGTLPWAVKSALLSLEIEPMFVEDVQDLYYDCMVFLLSLATKDEDIIHVDDHNTFVDELSEDIIHHCLENCQTIGQTKEHDKRFKQVSVHPKGCLPLISVFDPHILYPIRHPVQ